jgi:hypothetical protein
MGKKGVILDNGKAARSSMSLYWKAAENRKKDKTVKKETPEVGIEDRADSNFDKWKEHKNKMITKLYDKLEKKDKTDHAAEL